MKDRLSLIAEPAGAVGHHALALGRPDRGAQVRFLAEVGFALAAFGRVERDDMVADLHRGYARAHLAHDSSAFMAKDRREDALRILALQRVGRSEEHTSELQSLMRISYAVFCLKKKNNTQSHLRVTR